MPSYLTKTPTAKKTPQSKPIPGREKEMTRNNAGGFAFKADSWMRMERFLILGSEGGSYYVGESDLTAANVDNVRACIAQDGARAVKMITDISVGGRAPKNDPALYALALAASYGGDLRTRAIALDNLSKVARTGTHLFTFCQFIDTMRGWGKNLQHAVSNWYLDKKPEQLAYQLVKYQSRNGWSHRDVMRLAHPKADLKIEHANLLRWVMKGAEATPDNSTLIQAFELAKNANEDEILTLIKAAGLTHEMIPTKHHKSPKVWEALLEKMPLTAMIRSLGRMGSIGLLTPLSEASKTVMGRLGDVDYLRKSRIHPLQVLAAFLTYKQGRGQRGSLSWTPDPRIVDALDSAFEKTFDNVLPTYKRFYLGIDISGSMTRGEVAGMVGLTPNMGAAAMAMLIARREPNHFIGGFSTRFIDIGISKADGLARAMQKCQGNFGGTDTAVVIKHALDNKYPVDAFVVITDGETWAGNIHTSQALEVYRQKMGFDSKLVVINMVPNHTRITDPTDAGSLDVVGFDSSVPTLINGFLGADAKTTEEESAD